MIDKENNMDEKQCLQIRLAMAIQENQEREAQAVTGYTEMLGIIEKLIDISTDSQEVDFLESLKAETEEKISDELNHQQGLLEEYVEFTGIKINKD